MLYFCGLQTPLLEIRDKQFGSELSVGTGDSPAILRFYERCGFVKSHVVKNFFIDNYDHPMYEDGQQLVDMIYLKRNL